MILDGKTVALAVKNTVKTEIRTLKITPKLTVVQVGNDPASTTYVNNKRKAAEYCGIEVVDVHLDENITENELCDIIKQLNSSDTDGILVQLPLPQHINERIVIETIDPTKDVDCFTYENVGRLVVGTPRFEPCTPAGIIEILKFYKIPLEGKNIVVIGRSNIVGKPISMMLQRENANVTMFHSKSGHYDISHACHRADVIVVATGCEDTITESYLSKYRDCTIIDVGIHRTESGLCGDVSEETKQKTTNYTPVPGGVGPMTVAMLMKNVLTASKLAKGV